MTSPIFLDFDYRTIFRRQNPDVASNFPTDREVPIPDAAYFREARIQYRKRISEDIRTYFVTKDGRQFWVTREDAAFTDAPKGATK